MSFHVAAMMGIASRRGTRFTIYHGLVASVALHALLLPAYMLSRLEPEDNDRSMLVSEMDGLVSDLQAEERIREDTEGRTRQNAQKAEHAEQTPLEDAGSPTRAGTAAADEKAAAKPEPAGATKVNGAEAEQVASTMAHSEVSEETLLRAYFKRVSKKIHARLVIPEGTRRAALRGVTKVGFRILAAGQILPETLKVVSSSGQSQLDASALKTIRVSAPFTPPPREMNVAIDVVFGPEH